MPKTFLASDCYLRAAALLPHCWSFWITSSSSPSRIRWLQTASWSSGYSDLACLDSSGLSPTAASSLPSPGGCCSKAFSWWSATDRTYTKRTLVVPQLPPSSYSGAGPALCSWTWWSPCWPAEWLLFWRRKIRGPACLPPNMQWGLRTSAVSTWSWDCRHPWTC